MSTRMRMTPVGRECTVQDHKVGPFEVELNAVRRAIVVVDLVESVRHMQLAESEVIGRWRQFVAAIQDDQMPQFGGKVVKSLGDGLLLTFEHCAEAVRAARAMHALLESLNRQGSTPPVLELRCGVHHGDVFADDTDVYGTAVNLAARLAGLAEPGGIVVSLPVRDELASDAGFDFIDLGECFVKHIRTPQRAFSLANQAVALQCTTQVAAEQASLRASVAVIPFSSNSPLAEHQALGDAFADDLIAALSKSPGLRVLSRLSTARFREVQIDAMAELHQRLNADYAVLGRIRWQSERAALVQVQLVELGGGEVIWTDQQSTAVSALFAGDDPIVPAVASALRAAVAASEVQRTRRLPIPNLSSFTLYLGGTALLHRLSESEFNRSRTVLESLSERVPRSAPPHAMLAKWHIFRMVQGWSDDRANDGAAARDNARRALDRDPGDAFSLAVQGLTASIVDADLDAAQACYERALEANANEPYAWALMSSMHSYRDRPLQAIEAAERAIAQSPADPALFLLEAHHALALLAAGRAAEAVLTAQRSLQLNAMHTPSHRLLIIALVLLDRMDEARVAAQRHALLEPHFRVSHYRERYPGRTASHAVLHARALLAAGIPA